MKRYVAFVVFTAVLAAIVVARRPAEVQADEAPAVDRSASAPPQAAAARRSEAASLDPPPTRIASTHATAVALPPPVADAAVSLADAMHGGDPRSPPIAHEEKPAEPPTVNELADPAAYRRYEARRQARVHRAFEREADIALADQRRDLDRAKALGAPPEILAEGEEKAQKLAQTLRRLRDGEFDAANEPATNK